MAAAALAVAVLPRPPGRGEPGDEAGNGAGSEVRVILNGALGAERIWLLLSDEPLAVSRLRPALDRLAAAVRAASVADLLAAAPGLLEKRELSLKVATWLVIKKP